MNNGNQKQINMTKKGLQKLTDMSKINAMFNLEQITFADYSKLSPEEGAIFCKLINEKINSLKGVEKDVFVKQIELITDQQTKNEIWEINHNQITWAISKLMQEYGRMPSKMEISRKTELSRQTIHKHLKEYASHPQYLGQVEQFRFMTNKVLTRVFDYAVNGNVKAAKLYFEVVGSLSNQLPGNTLIKNQNNYIQINGTILSQDTIKNLKPEQVLQIEGILKGLLCQPE